MRLSLRLLALACALMACAIVLPPCSADGAFTKEARSGLASPTMNGQKYPIGDGIYTPVPIVSTDHFVRIFNGQQNHTYNDVHYWMYIGEETLSLIFEEEWFDGDIETDDDGKWRRDAWGTGGMVAVPQFGAGDYTAVAYSYLRIGTAWTSWTTTRTFTVGWF